MVAVCDLSRAGLEQGHDVNGLQVVEGCIMVRRGSEERQVMLRVGQGFREARSKQGHDVDGLKVVEGCVSWQGERQCHGGLRLEQGSRGRS